MTVQNFMKIVWTVFEKFKIFMKRSGEKKQQKKRHDCICSRKFFSTPKNFTKSKIASRPMIVSTPGWALNYLGDQWGIPVCVTDIRLKLIKNVEHSMRSLWSV